MDKRFGVNRWVHLVIVRSYSRRSNDDPIFTTGDLKLSERDWICVKGNTTHDRDLNAGINIRNFAGPPGGLSKIFRVGTYPLSANVTHSGVCVGQESLALQQSWALSIFIRMLDARPQLKKLVNSLHPLPEPDWSALSAIWKPFSAKRKEIITLAGEREKYLYFVVEGVQRVYYFDEQHREATLVFTYAPSFGGVLDALLLQQPSRYFYETLTPSVFLRAAFTDLQALMQTKPAIEAMVRQGITLSLAGVLERLVELQCYSSEEKFRKLLHRSPHILQLVPHKYLANYLGIDATNFSKLVNRVKI